MDKKTKVKQGAVIYLARLLLQRAVGVALFFAAAGTFRDVRSATNLALYLGTSVIACIIMYASHQETLYERGKKQENTKGWDKLLLPVFVLLTYLGIYAVAGLGVRFGWNTMPIEWFYIGIALYIISSIFSCWAVMENKHFEETARIQDNRKQTVITTGPYRIVRHPGYSGIVVWALASAFMFGTLAVGVVACIIITIIWIRTFLEDRMLGEELEGYLEYTKAVRYRLIPFVW
jgi:protein-S-isoprenylcysteine O-methyltransferase Ste14